MWCQKKFISISRRILLIIFFEILITNGDIVNFRNICNPDGGICKCTNQTKEPTGIIFLKMDCTYKKLNIDNFQLDRLPITTELLDLSGNEFSELLCFNSDSLIDLVLSHNQILTIPQQNCRKLQNLKVLDLSWNHIERISQNAFSDMSSLEWLDLSHNRLKNIDFMIFSNLLNLKILDLSLNSINETKDLQELDFYRFYGITPRLKILKLNGCNLNNIHLNQGTSLQSLHLANNSLTKAPELPRNIKYLDLSRNPIETLGPSFLPHLFHLEELYLQDMPELYAVGEYAFFGLPALKVLSLQNSKNLKFFDLHAFGVNVVRNETDLSLEILNLRGTSLTTFNSSLMYAFENLKSLNLETPLTCNCDLKWLKSFHLDTKGRCHEPIELRGIELSKLSDSDLKCDWPEWQTNILNGFLILGLLILCGAGIWLIVFGFRTSRRKNIRHIGSSSPYARITIEPNCAENHF